MEYIYQERWVQTHQSKLLLQKEQIAPYDLWLLNSTLLLDIPNFCRWILEKQHNSNYYINNKVIFAKIVNEKNRLLGATTLEQLVNRKYKKK